jgi:hypothetical protein
MTAVPMRQIIEWRKSHEEILDTGKCTSPQWITAEVKAGNCACEIRNPQGFCCLGNVIADAVGTCRFNLLWSSRRGEPTVPRCG